MFFINPEKIMKNKLGKKKRKLTVLIPKFHCFLFVYQLSQRFAGFIAEPIGQLNAFANESKLLNAPFTRYFPGE